MALTRRTNYAAVLAVLGATLCSSAQAPAPGRTTTTLPKHGSAPSLFVPEGWTLEQQHDADLNGDGETDALLVLRGRQQAGAPPRMIAVVLRDSRGRSEYRLGAYNERLIPNGREAAEDDPMDEGEIAVRRGGFDVKLTLGANASYQTATVRFRFRYQDDCFRLIGFDRMETHRGTLATRDVSVNLLTGRVVHRTGNAQSDRSRVRVSRLKKNPRRCFSELGSAAAFNPL